MNDIRSYNDQPQDEASVVARAQDGDTRAFEQLVHTYQGPLFRFALSMVQDRGDAEDIVQETLVQAWRSLPGLTNLERFQAWIYRTTNNKCLDLIRKNSSHNVIPNDPIRLTDSPMNPSTNAGQDPAHEAEQTSRDEKLLSVLASIPAELRSVWILKELHEQSYAEIAATLKLNTTTVRGRLARSRQLIMEGMNSWR